MRRTSSVSGPLVSGRPEERATTAPPARARVTPRHSKTRNPRRDDSGFMAIPFLPFLGFVNGREERKPRATRQSPVEYFMERYDVVCFAALWCHGARQYASLLVAFPST